MKVEKRVMFAKRSKYRKGERIVRCDSATLLDENVLDDNETSSDRCFVNSERGVAILEFVIVGPLLVLLFIGIIDLGRMLNSHMIMTHVVREGVRLASGTANLEVGQFTTTQATSSAEPGQYSVHSRVQQLLDLEQLPVDFTVTGSGTLSEYDLPNDRVTVTIAGSYVAFFPLLNGLQISAQEYGPYLY